MFRPLRRHAQQLSDARTIALLEKGSSGTLALHGDNDYPYAVPMSYAYADGKLYFHAALSGHKIDAIKQNAKASFCLIAQDDVVPERYTTRYQSVICFGNIRFLETADERRAAMNHLVMRYAPLESIEKSQQKISDDDAAMTIFCLDIAHMTGKASRELINNA